MDHFVQIPSVGREWEDMLESTAALGYLAASTTTGRLGTLVTGITYRNIAHVAKIVATLDVLSGGRAFCGLGAAWYRREHELYGWDFPSTGERYDRFEDALQLLPLMWGKGTPRFDGRTITVPCGHLLPPTAAGPRADPRRGIGRTADPPARRPLCRRVQPLRRRGAVRHKVEVLQAHCAREGRDPDEVTITNLSEAAVLGGPAGASRRCGVSTVEEHIGRYRAFAEAGVQEAIVALRLDGTTDQLDAFARSSGRSKDEPSSRPHARPGAATAALMAARGYGGSCFRPVPMTPGRRRPPRARPRAATVPGRNRRHHRRQPRLGAGVVLGPDGRAARRPAGSADPSARRR